MNDVKSTGRKGNTGGKDKKDVDVILKIKDIRIFNDSEEQEDMEFITEGKLCRDGEEFCVTYEESHLSGVEGLRTRLRINKDAVSLIRDDVDDDRPSIKFEKGKRHKGICFTDLGPIEMEVLTNNIVNTIDKEGRGKIGIDYDISLKDLTEGRSRLDIEVNYAGDNYAK